jgi:hypothetical protein
MKEYIKKAFIEPPRTGNNLWKYGFLIMVIALLAECIYHLATMPPSYPYDKYGNIIIACMLLLNILAFQFRWPKNIMIAVRVIAWLWMLFGGLYIFYFARVLFPKVL